MHVMLSWDIPAEGERWKEINQQLRECLSSYSWVRPLKTVYVVKVDDHAERKALIAALTDVARSAPERVHFLMTPAMSGGGYNGFLPRDMWEKVTKRTES